MQLMSKNYASFLRRKNNDSDLHKTKYTQYKYLPDKKGLNWCVKIACIVLLGKDFINYFPFKAINADSELCLLETAFTPLLLSGSEVQISCQHLEFLCVEIDLTYPLAILHFYSDSREAMSIEKRYLTSDLTIRSYASLTCWIGMTSTSAVILCLPQKSSISWVSLIPPMRDPEILLRPKIRAKAATASGFSGAPTRVMFPSRPSMLM